MGEIQGIDSELVGYSPPQFGVPETCTKAAGMWGNLGKEDNILFDILLSQTVSVSYILSVTYKQAFIKKKKIPQVDEEVMWNTTVHQFTNESITHGTRLNNTCDQKC